MTDDNRFEDAVRRALAREADQTQPSPDGLHQIQRKVQTGQPRRARPWLLTSAGAVLGTAAAVGLFVVLNDDPGQQAGPGPASQPSTAPSSTVPTVKPTPAPLPTSAAATKPPSIAPTAAVTAAKAMPVYWVGDVVGRPDLAPRLYRTFVRVRDGDLALEAVRVMTERRPDDLDYSSDWAGARVRSVQITEKKHIAVDFAALPAARLKPDAANVAAQALVHTVQDAFGGVLPVQVTVNGAPAGRLFGQIDTSRPLQRAAKMDVQAAIWITTPANGETVSSPVTVTGIASVFEANVSWVIRSRAKRAVVDDGFVTASAGAPDFGDFKFSVKLPRGDYLVECFESSPEDGTATFTDSKLFTVR